jgi:hypothetical protein
VKSKVLDVELPWWVADCAQDLTTDVFWITGGLGSGKTTGCTILDMIRCSQNAETRKGYPPTKSWVVAPTHKKLEDIIIPAFEEVLPMYFGMMPDRDFRIYRGKPPYIKFRKLQHEIHLQSGDRPEYMVGTNITHWRMTEAGILKPEVYPKLQQRTRDPRAKHRQGIGEGTPEGTDNWYHDLANFEGYDPKNNFRRIRLESGDNRHLPADYVETKVRRPLKHDPQKLLSYEKGIFASFTKGTAYWEWIQSRNMLRETPYVSPHLPILYCWDFNKSPLAHSVMQRQPVDKNYDRYHRWVSLWESNGESRGLMDACAEFGARFPLGTYRDTVIELYGGHDGWNGGHNIDACDWETIKKYLKRIGYRNVVIKADRAAPDIRPSLEKIAALMVYELYLVSPECPKLMQSFSKTKLLKGMWDFEKPNEEDWTHWADGPRYCLFQLNKERNIVDPSWRPTMGVNI